MNCHEIKNLEVHIIRYLTIEDYLEEKMARKETSFIIAGPDAESGASEIQAIIRQELGYDPPILAGKETDYSDRTKGIDPIALAGLLLAIPGTILAVMELAGRLKKKQQLDNVLMKIRQQVVQKKRLTVKIMDPNGMIKEIDSIESSEILDYYTDYTGKE